MMLFEWSAMGRPIRPASARPAGFANEFDYNQLLQAWNETTPRPDCPNPPSPVSPVTPWNSGPVPRPARQPHRHRQLQTLSIHRRGFSAQLFGMIGIPIDLYPQFPTNANLVLLTESAKFDTDIVAKIKGQLTAGKSVSSRPACCTRSSTGHRRHCRGAVTPTTRCSRMNIPAASAPAMARCSRAEKRGHPVPEIFFLHHDAWPVVRLLANGNGYPLFADGPVFQGHLYIWTMPEKFQRPLLAAPQRHGRHQRITCCAVFPSGWTAPARWRCSLMTITRSSWNRILPAETDVKVSLTGNFTRLKNLVTGEVITGQARLRAVDAGGTTRKAACPSMFICCRTVTACSRLKNRTRQFTANRHRPHRLLVGGG